MTRKRNKLLRPINTGWRIWRGYVWFSSATAFFLLALCPANRAQSQTQNQLNGASAVETAGESNDSLLKSVQNPVADLISVPILSTTNFTIGPYNRAQNVLAAQPVIPANLTENWVLISRIILPLTWQPYPDKNTGGQFGLGDMTPSFFSRTSQSWQRDLGCGPSHGHPHRYQQHSGTGQVQPRSVGGRSGSAWSVDVGCPGEQCLVGGEIGESPSSEPNDLSIFSRLQPETRLVFDLCSNSGCGLARAGW